MGESSLLFAICKSGDTLSIFGKFTLLYQGLSVLDILEFFKKMTPKYFERCLRHIYINLFLALCCYFTK